MVTSASIALLVFERKLAKMVRSVGEDMKTIEGQILEYQSYTEYMTKRDRIGHGERLNSLLSHLQFLQRNQRLLGNHRRTLVGQYDSKLKYLSAFLEQFIPEYTKREVERHKAFFDSKSFDREQTEAIIKKDEYSLVIAGAGSGNVRAVPPAAVFHYGVRAANRIQPADASGGCARGRPKRRQKSAPLRNDNDGRGHC